MSFDLSGMSLKQFYSAPERESKGWSYSNVYYLRDIKDIYLLLYSRRDLSSVSSIFECCAQEGILSESKKMWTSRSILEIINALRNFEYLEKDSLTPLRGRLFVSNIGDELEPADISVLKETFFSYFRFREFADLYKTNNTREGIVFSFMENSRFVNRFLREDLETVFYIEDRHSEVMRFWDVFSKWGMSLGVLERVSNIDKCDGVLRNLSASFFIKPMLPTFSIIDTLEDMQLGTYIYIPEALKMIALKTRHSLRDLKAKVCEECLESDLYRLQSTSAIFVPEKEKALFPVIDNTFMSHLLKVQ